MDESTLSKRSSKFKLCLLNPTEVYTALTRDKRIKRWLSFIANEYTPPHKKILLLYPCSSVKPYHKSRAYKALYRTLSKLGSQREEIHVITVSEPFGLVPEEFYLGGSSGPKQHHSELILDYDCPGLFEWWCRRHNQEYSREYVEMSIDILSEYVSIFFKRISRRGYYEKVIAMVRTYTSKLRTRHDHTHKRIIINAARKANVNVVLLPSKDVVSKIVSERGRSAWDLYGVAHPLAQEELLDYLSKVL